MDLAWLYLRSVCNGEPQLSEFLLTQNNQAIATILAAIDIITTSFIAKTLFKLWVSVASNAFTMTFWIITAIVLGTTHHFVYCQGDQHNHCYRKRYYHGRDGLWAATLALSVIDGYVPVLSLCTGLWLFRRWTLTYKCLGYFLLLHLEFPVAVGKIERRMRRSHDDVVVQFGGDCTFIESARTLWRHLTYIWICLSKSLASTLTMLLWIPGRINV